jgi:hypothetical protein
VVVMAGRMSVAEKQEIWRLLRAGTSFRVIGRGLGRSDALKRHGFSAALMRVAALG